MKIIKDSETESGRPNLLNKEAFRKLNETLLKRLLDETETLQLHTLLKTAANEAAALAWSSGFPLLVYPVLLAEKTQIVRVRHYRREKVLQRSQMLMGHSV